MISQLDKTALMAAARAAVAKAFLTKEGGVRYGAAVLTSAGAIHSSGQYSSFNHSTNVHAEQSALVAAAMAGDADVVALAVASTGTDPVTRPCGVCRQVMLEHATRTGRDFAVLMDAGNSWEEATVSALLPYAWESASQKIQSASPEPLRTAPKGGVLFSDDLPLQVGDHVRLKGGLLALVWDPLPWGGSILVKLKYQDTGAGGWSKFSHAFSQPQEYERELDRFCDLAHAPCGANVACARPADIEEIILMPPAPELPPVLHSCLRQAGIGLPAVQLSGSRSTGMFQAGSDLDLVVTADPAQAASLRKVLTSALASGELTIPRASGTWRVLSRLYPGGSEAILRNTAFAETFEEAGLPIALMIRSLAPVSPVHSDCGRFAGLATFAGRVVESSQSIFKRAVFTVQCPAHGLIEVVCYHKAANLVRVGDAVAVRGWLVEEQGRRMLLQFHPHRENIVWFPST